MTPDLDEVATLDLVLRQDKAARFFALTGEVWCRIMALSGSLESRVWDKIYG